MELASDDRWIRVEDDSKDAEGISAEPPTWHIGRMKPGQNEILSAQANLPWDTEDSPKQRFEKLVNVVREVADKKAGSVDLEVIFDKYLQTIWSLSLAAPLSYIEGHPFDLPDEDGPICFEIENSLKGQASRITMKKGESVRKTLGLKTKDGADKNEFRVLVDGVQLFRPVIFRNLPKGSSILNSPLLFIGKDRQTFSDKPTQLSGGPLAFEAYLYWAPKIIPKQHQGINIRVGNASGTAFDSTFLGYQIQELTRLKQITAEIYISEGLDEALNIDRESFNYAHPHYQYLVKWLHSALRQLANREKDIGKNLRLLKAEAGKKHVKEAVSGIVESSLKSRRVYDVPEVKFVDATEQLTLESARKSGTITIKRQIAPHVLNHHKILNKDKQISALAEKKTIAIMQVLNGWGLVEKLDYDSQDRLANDILNIILIKD
jgi:hypothetical protein